MAEFPGLSEDLEEALVMSGRHRKWFKFQRDVIGP